MKAQTPIRILQKASSPPPKANSSSSISTTVAPALPTAVTVDLAKGPPAKSQAASTDLTQRQLKAAQAKAVEAAEKAFERESGKYLGLYGKRKDGSNRQKPKTLIL